MRLFVKGLTPLRAHPVSDSALDSARELLKNIISRGRLILRSYFRKEIEVDSNRYQLRLPQFPEDIANGSRFAAFKEQSQRICHRPGFFQKVVTKWASNTLAATLGREAGKKLFRGSGGPVLAFVGFTLTKKPTLLTEKEELEGISFEIRDAFSHLPWDVCYKNKGKNGCFSGVQAISKFEDLKIGHLIAKGCNAAVYSACLKGKNTDFECRISAKTSGKLIISHSEQTISSGHAQNSVTDDNIKEHSFLPTGRLFPLDLAVKVMFNYDAESNAFAIVKAMQKEILPALFNFPSNNIISYSRSVKNKLPPHPNIVEMYCAFADLMPSLPEAFTFYPHALPQRLIEDGCGRNMTLFLVMKRYHCSLKDYLKFHQPSNQASLILLTQLLEGLVHLLQNNIAHRDLKADNILLDLSHGVSKPTLAITDFGCCLEGLKLSFQSDEIDRGGNMALMAPEVATAEAGPFTSIDFSRSDLWTVGCLAYEIFGCQNPFYTTSGKCLLSATYKECELPMLSPGVHKVLRKLVSDMLSRDPKMRPSPALAATVCQLLLHAPVENFADSDGQLNYRKLAEWMFFMSAKTFFQATLFQSQTSSVEFQLRYTFCLRIQFSDLIQAMQYIMSA